MIKVFLVIEVDVADVKSLDVCVAPSVFVGFKDAAAASSVVVRSDVVVIPPVVSVVCIVCPVINAGADVAQMEVAGVVCSALAVIDDASDVVGVAGWYNPYCYWLGSCWNFKPIRARCGEYKNESVLWLGTHHQWPLFVDPSIVNLWKV